MQAAYLPRPESADQKAEPYGQSRVFGHGVGEYGDFRAGQWFHVAFRGFALADDVCAGILFDQASIAGCLHEAFHHAHRCFPAVGSVDVTFEPSDPSLDVVFGDGRKFASGEVAQHSSLGETGSSFRPAA